MMLFLSFSGPTAPRIPDVSPIGKDFNRELSKNQAVNVVGAKETVIFYVKLQKKYDTLEKKGKRQQGSPKWKKTRRFA